MYFVVKWRGGRQETEVEKFILEIVNF